MGYGKSPGLSHHRLIGLRSCLLAGSIISKGRDLHDLRIESRSIQAAESTLVSCLSLRRRIHHPTFAAAPLAKPRR